MSDEAIDTLIRSLLSPAIYGGATSAVELVETHLSWVLLTGTTAYKIKKPLRLPFVDFTTLDARRRFCEEELRLNARLAADLYLAVTPIGGTVERPRLGELPAIEYAVKMRQFPAGARLDERIAAGAVSQADIVSLAELIGRFHAGLAPAPAGSTFGTARSVRATVEKNLREAAAECPAGLPRDDPIHGFLRARGTELAPVLDERRRAGAIREGHGDLHLENLVVWGGHIVPFDALEFDPALRWIDVMDETAFLTMDLMAHGRVDFAFRYLDCYLEVTGEYEGLRVLAYYLVHRALVRAKVRAIKARQTPASHVGEGPAPYLALAHELVAARPRVLVLTHGLSGSGKTTWTERLIPDLPAVRLRSDSMRKRLAGLDEHARSGSPVGGGIYAPILTEATYAALARGAAAGLAAGIDVIVDAAFLDRARRQEFADLAAQSGAGFVILDFHAPVDVLRRRIEARGKRGRDASEADLAVLEYQLAHGDPLSREERARSVRIETQMQPSLARIVASARAARC